MREGMQVPLSRGLFAIVDPEDCDDVLRYRWTAVRPTRSFTFYAVRREGGRTIYMHRHLTGFAVTDHINGDGLDNRRLNLREATRQQNQFNQRRRSDNTSGFKGVSLDKRSGRWNARIKASGKQHYLGYFATAEDAALAYDAAAREHHGEFARLNFPEVGDVAA